MPQNHCYQIKLPKIISLLLAVLVILTPVSHTFAQGTSIDLDDAEVLLGSINDAAANAWLDVKEEYDQSFGSNGCYARQWYMEGYTVGVLAETATSLAKAGKLGNVKVADLNKVDSGDAKATLNATESILNGAQSVKFVASSKLGKGIINARLALVPTLDRWKSLGGDWDPRAHHILLQSFRNSSSPNEAALVVALDDIWQAEGYPLFDLDDGVINGVFLPYKLHKGGHSGTTYTDVIRAEMQSFVDQNPSRAQVIAKIAEIREELITGRGSVYKINSVWDDTDAGEYMDAVANTLSAYND